MTHEESADKGAYMTLGIMLGAAAGLIAGVLTAPRSGEETRARLRAKSMETKERARREMASRSAQMSEKLSQGLDKTSDTIDNLSTKVKNSGRKTSATDEEEQI